jgi:hypothetical protein
VLNGIPAIAGFGAPEGLSELSEQEFFGTVRNNDISSGPRISCFAPSLRNSAAPSRRCPEALESVSIPGLRDTYRRGCGSPATGSRRHNHTVSPPTPKSTHFSVAPTSPSHAASHPSRAMGQALPYGPTLTGPPKAAGRWRSVPE